MRDIKLKHVKCWRIKDTQSTLEKKHLTLRWRESEGEREQALLPDAKCTSSKRHTLAGPTTEISRLRSERGREGGADMNEGGRHTEPSGCDTKKYGGINTLM